MIKQIAYKPVTDNSKPFTSAVVNADLAKKNYVEEEYFFSGVSNVYGKNKDNQLQVLVKDAPYTNRFLVRKPKEISARSGRVLIEILNTSSFIDIDRSWILLHQQLIRNGDTYIGITSKPITMKTMRRFDHVRYAELNWNNPRTCTTPRELLGNFYGYSSSPETEDGLFWDMLTDLALLCREKCDFLDGEAAEQLYLIGWSQSGGYMNSYTNYFAKDRYEKHLSPVFDGYFSMDPGNSVAPALNQEETVRRDLGEYSTLFSNVPYYVVTTQSLLEMCGEDVRKENINSEKLQYWVNDIAGTTHDTVFSMDTYLKDRTDELSTGMYLNYNVQDPYPNDFPYQLAYHAALMQFYAWVEDGELPPELPHIEVDDHFSPVLDERGNVKGGWRLPEIEFPVCTYKTHPLQLVPWDEPSLCYGSELPFTPECLKNLYGSLTQYRIQVTEYTASLVEKKLLLKEDAAFCVEHAVEKAKKYGLE